MGKSTKVPRTKVPKMAHSMSEKNGDGSLMRQPVEVLPCDAAQLEVDEFLVLQVDV